MEYYVIKAYNRYYKSSTEFTDNLYGAKWFKTKEQAFKKGENLLLSEFQVITLKVTISEIINTYKRKVKGESNNVSKTNA